MPLSFLNQKISTLHSAALILGAAGFLSRLLGLLRDRLLAGTFGASRELDIYYAAFQIPDVLYTILLLGAGSVAILPIFMEIFQRNPKHAEEFMNALITFFSFSAFIGICIGFILAPSLSHALFPGFDAASLEQVILLTRIMLISPLLLGLSGILMSAVQASQKFIAYAVSGIVYNIGIIAGILFFVPYFGLKGLALGVILGAVFHLISQVQVYYSLGFRIRPVRDFFTPAVRGVFAVSLPRVIALSFTQITLTILIGIASTLHQGSIAVFQFANNLGFLPLGIFAVGYATALFPRFSENALRGDGRAFFENLFFGIRIVSFWVVPMVFLSIVLRAHIVRVALGAGAFDWGNTRLTAAAFALFLIALFGESLRIIFLRALYALQSTWMPLFMTACSMIFAVFSGIFFVHQFQAGGWFSELVYSLLRVSDVAGGEVLGVVLGFSLGTLMNAVLLMIGLFALRFSAFGSGGEARYYEYGDLVFPILKIVFSSFIGASASYDILSLLSNYFILDTFANVFLEGLIAGAGGVAVYLIILYGMKSEDLESLLESMKRRFFRLGILPAYWNEERTRIE